MVKVEGGTSKEDVTMYYRCGFEAFAYLFGNPLFVDNMDFIPYKLWRDQTRKVRVFNKSMSGTKAWKIQVRNISVFFTRHEINSTLG